MPQYQDLPHNYLHCLAGNEACPRKDTCLRAIAARMLEESGAASPVEIHALNPNIARNAGEEGCPFYRDSAPVRLARGMTRLFDNVPAGKVDTLRSKVIGCFSSRSIYFFSRKGERLITPEEQQAIARVFQKYVPGVEPKYDAYVTDTLW